MRKYPHSAGCKCGYHRGKGDLDPDHPWYINSLSHHNCFWTYLKHNTRKHTLAEVAEYLDLSISAITSIERKAVGKLRNNPKAYNIIKLLKDL